MVCGKSSRRAGSPPGAGRRPAMRLRSPSRWAWRRPALEGRTGAALGRHRRHQHGTSASVCLLEVLLDHHAAHRVADQHRAAAPGSLLRHLRHVSHVIKHRRSCPGRPARAGTDSGPTGHGVGSVALLGNQGQKVLIPAPGQCRLWTRAAGLAMFADGMRQELQDHRAGVVHAAAPPDGAGVEIMACSGKEPCCCGRISSTRAAWEESTIRAGSQQTFEPPPQTRGAA